MPKITKSGPGVGFLDSRYVNVTGDTMTGALIVTAANASNFVPITINQNDTTNNLKGLVIVNEGTGDAIEITQNGNGRVFDIINAGTDTGMQITQNGVLASNRSAMVFTTAAAQTTSLNGLIRVDITNTSSSIPGIFIDQLGTGTGATIRGSNTGNLLFVDRNSNGITIFADKDVTNTNSTTTCVTIDHTSVVNDAGTYTKTAAALQINTNVTETSGTITDSAITVDINQTHTDATGRVLDVQNSGTGDCMFANQDNNGIGINLDKDTTNSNNSSTSMTITHTSNVSDGNTYTKTGSALQITSNVSETSGTITDSADVLSIDQNHADATGNVIDADNDGTGIALRINQDGTLTTNKAVIDMTWSSDNSSSGSRGLYVNSNFAHTNTTLNRGLVFILNDNASSTATGILLQQDGTNTAFHLDNNNTGISLDIDHDGNSASEIKGLTIDVANAGAGVPTAIEVKAGRSVFGGRILGKQGADVASANDLTLGAGGNVFEITAANQINAITTTNWQNGSIIILLFTSTPTVKHNTAGGANTAVMILSGAADFVASADDTLTLVLSEIGGTQAWREVSRSVN